MKCQNPDCNNNVAEGPGRTGKFCSSSCSAKVNNRNRRKVILCIRCSNQVKDRHMKYCSRLCWQTHRSENRINAWLLGNETGCDASGELSRPIRTYLIDEANNKCTICNWGIPNPLTGKVILTVDHVDGNWKNNSRDNLIVLCYNCHTLTPTFGSLNRGKGVGPRSIGSRRH
jgi:hypothetical protein